MNGCGAGLFFSSKWVLGTLLEPPADAGRYLGIQNLAAAGAGAVGAYIGAPIADYFSLSFPHIAGLGYSVLNATFGICYLLSAAALTRVRSV